MSNHQKGANIAFVFLELLILVMVLITVYVSFQAVAMAIDRNGVSKFMHLPIVAVLFIFPVSLYSYYKRFKSGEMMISILWLMGTSALVVTLLYLFLAKITG